MTTVWHNNYTSLDNCTKEGTHAVFDMKYSYIVVCEIPDGVKCPLSHLDLLYALQVVVSVLFSRRSFLKNSFSDLFSFFFFCIYYNYEIHKRLMSCYSL